MREFVVLAECLNYTQAAQRLFISQPALTRHIAAVEEEMGVELLARDTHVRELTVCGKLVLNDFKKILESYDTLSSRAQRFSAGTTRELKLGVLHYGAGQNYAYPAVNLFQKKFPATRLSVLSMLPNQMNYKLRDASIDVGVNITSRFYPDDALEYVCLGHERLYAIMLRSNPLSSREKLTPAELAKAHILLMSLEREHEYHIRTLFKYNRLELENVDYVDDIDAMLREIERTDGIFIGTKMLASLPREGLGFVEIDSEDFEIDVSLAYLKENGNPAIDEMIECATSAAVRNS